MTLRIAVNPLETRRFGVTCARAESAAAAEMPAIDRWCRDQRVDMLTIRMAVDDFALIHAVEAAGGRLMDSLIYYERPLPLPDLSVDPRCRAATRADLDAVSRIARVAFDGYFGHYHADPRLDDAAATDGMTEWAESGLKADPAPPYWVWEDADGIGGFSMGALKADGSGDVVLNAVDPGRQKQGIYAALIRQACVTFSQMGLPRVELSTQVQNYAVQRVWARAGFTHFKSLYTFHIWYS